MKRIIGFLCVFVMTFGSFSFVFAEEESTVLRETSKGYGFVTIEGESLEALRNQDVIFDSQLGQIFFSKEIRNYLIDHCGGELSIAYYNNSSDEAFMQEDYLFVSLVVFTGKDGSVIHWEPALGKASLTANLDYPIEKERKLTYYYHADTRGDRDRIQGTFDKATNSITFDVTDGFLGCYAVFYDDSAVTGRPEKGLSIWIYSVAGAALLIVAGAAIGFYKMRSKQ